MVGAVPGRVGPAAAASHGLPSRHTSYFAPAGRVNPSAGPRRAVIQIKILGARDNRAYDARSLAVESQAPAAERPIALPPASVGAYNVDDDIRDDVNRGHLS